jgi:hypothetical protein
MVKNSLYIVIATCFILISCTDRGEVTSSPPNAVASEITLSNWISHPEIKEIRKIYQDIKENIKIGKYKTKKIRYDYESEKCTSTYPAKWEEIAYDKQKITKLYIFSQIISHGDTLTIERYYDDQEQLRFVLILWEYSGTERIYLNAKGDIIFAVAQKGQEHTVTQYEKDEFPVKPSKSDGLFNEFTVKSENPDCPIIK